MCKRDVLSVLSLFVGGTLSMTLEGAVVGVPMLAVSAYSLAGSKTLPSRAAVSAALGRFPR